MLELNPMIASQLRQRDSYFPNVQVPLYYRWLPVPLFSTWC